MSESSIVAKVVSYRKTGVCEDAELAKLCDENPGESRYSVARMFIDSGKKIAPAKKKKAPAKKKKVAKKK